MRQDSQTEVSVGRVTVGRVFSLAFSLARQAAMAVYYNRPLHVAFLRSQMYGSACDFVRE